MKRQLTIFFLLFLTVFVLAGCDFLSTLDSDILSSLTSSETTSETDTTISDSETTTTEPESTTETTETTQPTTGTTTQTTTTSGSATTTMLLQVIFYNEDGTVVLDTQLVAEGASATAPADPTKESTARYHYVFAGWDKSFNEVTSPLDVYATFTEVLRQYTVTFYDEDGSTVLDSALVDYGAAANAPDEPTKVGFDFGGWDKSFDFITGDLDVFAYYVTPFDHMLLVEFMVNRFGMNPDSPANIESAIDMMLLMTEIPTESELYNLLINGEMLIGQVQDITSLPELQTWFTSLSAAGFDEQQIVDFLINLLVFQVDQGVSSFDLQYYLDEIAFFEAKIIENVDTMNDIDDAVAVYCSTVPVHGKACLDFYEANILSLNWEDSYYELMSVARQSNWYNWDFMYTLEYRLWDYVWNENDLAYDDYLAMLATLGEPAKTIYTDLGSIYLAWQRNQLYGEQPLREILNTVYDIAQPTRTIAEVVFYNYIDLFRTAYYDNQSCEYVIMELEQQMMKRQEELKLLQEVQTYVHSPEGIIRIKLVLISLYDLVTDIVMNTDPALFDLLYGFASGETDPALIVWTPELIHGYLQHALAFFDVIELSMDETEKTLIGLFLSDLVGIYVRSLDLPALEEAGLIVEYNTILLYYLNALDEIYTMMDTFLTNLTPEQIGIVMEILPILINGGKIEPTPVLSLSMEEPVPVETGEVGIGSEAEMVQAIATLVHVLCTDAGLDPALLAGYAIDVYFLVRYGPNGADPVQIAAIKAAVLDNIEQLILLSNEIVTFDVETMTPEQLAVGYEFFERMQYFASIFKSGPEGIDLNPDFGISLADFEALVGRFIRPKNEEELDAAVAMMLGIFNLPMEETYFTLLSFMPLIQEMQMINSYESFLQFYESLPGRGFSNEMISEYLVNFLVGFVDLQIIRENTNFAQYVAYLEQAILYSGDQIDYFEDAIATRLAEFEVMIATLTPEDQAKVRAYMDMFDLVMQAELDRQAAEDYAINNAPNNDLFWTYSYYSLEWQLRCKYMYPESYAFYADLYASEWGLISPEVQALYLPVINAATIYYQHLYTDLPHLASIGLTIENNSIFYQLENYLNSEYYNQVRMLEYYYQDYANLVDQFAEAQAPNTAMLLAMQTFFNEPESVQLVKDVVLIMLDEAGYYITNIDPTTIALIQSLMEASNPGDVLDTTAAGILGYVDRLSDILDMIGMTISAEDDATLQLFATKVLWIVLEQTGMTPEELAIHFPVYEAAITEVYFKAEQVLLIFNAFLDSLTEAKIQVVMDQIAILNTIPADEYILPEELNYYNFLRAIAIANIIQALAGDGSLDTDTLIAYSIQGYFDYEYLFEYSGPIDEAALIAEKQALIDAIILQCGVIDEYLPTTIDPIEIGEIDELRILIEQLIFFLQTGPEYIPE